MVVAGSSLFKKADRRKKKLRLAIDGPAGSGKTLTALRFAMVIARHEAAKAGRPNNPRVAVIDTENGSASIYQGDVYDGHPIEFDVIELAEFSPTRYSEITREAARLGYDVLVIDSLSHAWSGKGGALELVDRQADKNKGNSFSGWKDITPLQTEMIDTIIRSSCHVLATMRTKTEWVLETNERGKSVPRKVGMAPVQRQGVEYEFDVVLDIDEDHIARVTKSRCSAIADKASTKPGGEFIGAVISWLDQGSEIPQEILDRAAMFDAPAESKGAGATAAQQPAAVGTDDLAARMAAKKAAAAATQGTPANATVAPVATQQSLPLADKAPAASVVETAAASTTATQANSAGGATQAVTQPVQSPAKSVQSPLLAEISALFAQLEIPVEVQQTAITKRGGTKLEELTEEAAKNLLDGLRSIAAGKSPVAPVSTVAPAPAMAPASTTVTETAKPTGPAMITGAQQDRIRKLFEQLQVPAEARVAAYQKRGASALAELTESGANDLIHKLVGMSTGLDQLSAMQMPVNDFIDLPDGTKKMVQCADGSAPFDPTPVASGAA